MVAMMVQWFNSCIAGKIVRLKLNFPLIFKPTSPFVPPPHTSSPLSPGAIISEKIMSEYIKPLDYLYLILLYLLLHIVRFVTILICSPVLHYMGYKLSWKEMAVIVYGGTHTRERVVIFLC